jgi:hypothetical protein
LRFVPLSALQQRNDLMPYEAMGANILARSPGEPVPQGYRERGKKLHELVQARAVVHGDRHGQVVAMVTDGTVPVVRTYASVAAAAAQHQQQQPASQHGSQQHSSHLQRRRQRVERSPQPAASPGTASPAMQRRRRGGRGRRHSNQNR